MKVENAVDPSRQRNRVARGDFLVGSMRGQPSQVSRKGGHTRTGALKPSPSRKRTALRVGDAEDYRVLLAIAFLVAGR